MGQKDKVVMMQCLIIRIREYYLYSNSKIKQNFRYENKKVYSHIKTQNYAKIRNKKFLPRIHREQF